MATKRMKRATVKKTVSETAKVAAKGVVGFTLGTAVAPIAGVVAPIVGTATAIKKATDVFDNKEWIAVDENGKRISIKKASKKTTGKKGKS